MIVAAAFGGFSSIFSAVDLVGFLYYIAYIDARFPANVAAFYEFFGNFKLSFMPSIFSSMVSSKYI
jgi:hypothetical protein